MISHFHMPFYLFGIFRSPPFVTEGRDESYFGQWVPFCRYISAHFIPSIAAEVMPPA